jgi:UDP-2-acetamido-3-amino-2,3-dideoxy-glucuronate N-acetyltransferase
MIDPSAKIHRLALVEDCEIGPRTRVWQFASVIRGTRLGADCNVASCATLDGPVFGDRCIISQGVAMGPGFEIGDDVFIGPNVTVCNDRWPRAYKTGFDLKKFQSGFVTVRIGNWVSIGANAVILPGVVLGKRVMVAAGAVVDRNVPPDCLYTRAGKLIPINEQHECRHARARMREAIRC